MIVEMCALPTCSRFGYVRCFVCERLFCGLHSRRLPQWCQFHQDCCTECYETLPAERKMESEVADQRATLAVLVEAGIVPATALNEEREP